MTWDGIGPRGGICVNGKYFLLSSRQAAMVIAASILETGLIVLPATLSEIAGRDAWLAALTAAGMIAGWSLVMAALARRFHPHSLMEGARIILGRFLGSAAAGIYLLYWLLVSAKVLREWTEITGGILLPRTPPVVVMILMLLPVAIAARQGIEELARTMEILLPLQLLVIVPGFIVSIPKFDPHNFLPVLAEGPGRVLYGGLIMFQQSEGLEVILMLAPALAAGTSWAAVSLIGVGIPLALALGAIATITAVFGPSEAGFLLWPVLAWMRQIRVPVEILERPDLLFTGVWITAAYTTIAMNVFLVSTGAARLLGLKSHRGLVLPFAAAALVLASLPRGIDAARAWSERLGWFNLVPLMVMPLLLLVTSWIRGMAGGAPSGAKPR